MNINDFAPCNAVLNELGRIVPGVNTTVDINPNSTVGQAKKFGNKVSKDGIPPLLKANGKIDRSIHEAIIGKK